MSQGIILAAGLGRRMGDITKATPKSLLKIDGLPIIERNIQFMADAGLERVVLVVGYMKERFSYLEEKYRQANLVLVENEDYETSNTVSSMWAARSFLDRPTFVTTADIYLKENIYEKYPCCGCCYVLRPSAQLGKPEWTATLDINGRIVAVDEHSLQGHSYTGISHWDEKGLRIIRRKLDQLNWSDASQRALYWDALLLDELKSLSVKAEILEDDKEIYEFDDLSDIEKFEGLEGIQVDACRLMSCSG